MKEVITVYGVEVETWVSHSCHHRYDHAKRLDFDVTLTRTDLGCRGEVFKYEVVAYVKRSMDDLSVREVLYSGYDRIDAWEVLLTYDIPDEVYEENDKHQEELNDGFWTMFNKHYK